MRPGLFRPAEFDVICLFQVFDHVPDPGTLLGACFTALRSGGLVLSLNHNVTAVSALLLGERSPIIDIEHTYLYSPTTMRRIFRAAGLRIREHGRVNNTYSVSYVTHLTPIPARAKALALGALNRSGLGRFSLPVPLGNLYLIAERP
jgi:SAM-dependent methyltransferase